MRKALSLLIAVVLIAVLLISCGDSPDIYKPPKTKDESTRESQPNDDYKEEPPISNESKTWQELYVEFFADNEHGINVDSMYLNYLSLYDLNFDGTPELIVSDGAASAGYSVGIFQIIDGRVECVLGSVSGCIDKTHSYSLANRNDFILYSNFDDNWITLRKNKKTGEKKYVISSSNGDSECSFGSLVGICQQESNPSLLKAVNEFEYVEYWETSKEDIFKVSGRETTKESYEALMEEFNALWVDTGISNYAMIPQERNYLKYKKKVALSLDKEELMKYFEIYNK